MVLNVICFTNYLRFDFLDFSSKIIFSVAQCSMGRYHLSEFSQCAKPQVSNIIGSTLL